MSAWAGDVVYIRGVSIFFMVINLKYINIEANTEVLVIECRPV